VYGIEIRKIVLKLIQEEKKSPQEVSKFMKISERSIARWKALAKKEDLAPKTNALRKKKIDVEALSAYVEKNPDHILDVIAKQFNVRASAIWYRLKQMKITLKKRQRCIGSAMKQNVRNL